MSKSEVSIEASHLFKSDGPTQKKPSLPQSEIPLFDVDATLSIPRNVADGYLILLSGGMKSAKALRDGMKAKRANGGESSSQSFETNREMSMVKLSFAAITEGNVVEATFGVECTGGMRKGKNTSEKAFNNSRRMKAALVDASIASEGIPTLVVNTYIRSFEVVSTYHMKIEQLGFISWCWRHQKIREMSITDLKKAFEPLKEALNAST